MASPVVISVSFRGQTHSITASTTSTAADVFAMVIDACQLQGAVVKVLLKGKMLQADDHTTVVFPVAPTKSPKAMVMASSRTAVQDIQDKKSDPTIRGFVREETKRNNNINNSVWGSGQDRNYKFVKFEACTKQSFGHRAGERTPHAFVAHNLLQKLAEDPGVVAILRERQLVVNTLGEMDPIDDRLQQKKAEHGACLLGYNTNHGLAIDIRLRTFDLQGFLPYPQLMATLIHELSHNWVGEHNLLFWGNFAQMRVEYLHTHARLGAQGYLANGQSTAVLAGVSEQCRNGMSGIAEAVMQELAQEMPSYGLSPQPLGPAILSRCRELTAQYNNLEAGQALGRGEGRISEQTPQNSRQAALEAAERRAKKAKEDGKGNPNE